MTPYLVKKTYKSFFLLLINLLIYVAAGACGNESSAPLLSSQSQLNRGALRVLLTSSASCGAMHLDTPSGSPVLNVAAVYVTIDRVEVNKNSKATDEESPWLVVSGHKKTINLSKLVSGVQGELGLNDLEIGFYRQIRLILSDEPDGEMNILNQPHPAAHYFIDSDNHIHVLKVVSEFQSGIKLSGDFTIQGETTTELLLDFDLQRSIVIAGSSGEFLLNPTLKIVGEISDVATLTGQILDSETQQAISGATLSFQVVNKFATDPKDRVKVITTGSSDLLGNFSILLPPGNYILVASADNFTTEVVRVNLLVGESKVENLLLQPSANNGSCRINLFLSDNIEFASLSLRGQLPFENGEILAEEAFANLADGASVGFLLPVGDYILVVSRDEWTTQEFILRINSSQQTNLELHI